MLAPNVANLCLGTVLGIAVGAAYSNRYLALTLETISAATEFWAAMLGAIVGGVISYVLQIRSFREARNNRDEKEKQRRKAMGISLLFKVIRIYSGITHIKSHFDECLESKPQVGEDAEPFQYIRPILNLPTGEKFTADELALLIALKDDEATNTVISLDDSYEGILSALLSLNKSIENLRSGLPAEFTGELAEIRLDPSEVKFVRPKMIAVNSVAAQSQNLILEHHPRAEKALEALTTLLKSKLDIGIDVSKKNFGTHD